MKDKSITSTWSTGKCQIFCVTVLTLLLDKRLCMAEIHLEDLLLALFSRGFVAESVGKVQEYPHYLHIVM
jgi:hypothetical protein